MRRRYPGKDYDWIMAEIAHIGAEARAIRKAKKIGLREMSRQLHADQSGIICQRLERGVGGWNMDLKALLQYLYRMRRKAPCFSTGDIRRSPLGESLVFQSY
jgi:hypothetical protein